MDKCKLCNKERTLCDSHIIPEFYYKKMYDPKHKLFRLTNILAEQVKYRFKGVYEKLLCEKCENKLNEHETYVIQQFSTFSSIVCFEDDEVIIINNLDYLHFRLFTLSIIWRASISSKDLFFDVDLGRNEEIIRKMLFDNDPGKYDLYPIMMFAIVSKNQKITFDLVTNPELFKINECWAYRFVFGGFVWIYLFGDTNNFYLKRLFFNPNGSVIIPKKNLSNIDFLVEFGFDLYRQGKFDSILKN